MAATPGSTVHSRGRQGGGFGGGGRLLLSLHCGAALSLRRLQHLRRMMLRVAALRREQRFVPGGCLVHLRALCGLGGGERGGSTSERAHGPPTGRG